MGRERRRGLPSRYIDISQNDDLGQSKASQRCDDVPHGVQPPAHLIEQCIQCILLT